MEGKKRFTHLEDNTKKDRLDWIVLIILLFMAIALGVIWNYVLIKDGAWHDPSILLFAVYFAFMFIATAVVLDILWLCGSYKLSPEGVELNYFLLKNEKIRWSEIQEIYIAEMYAYRTIPRTYYVLYLSKKDETKPNLLDWPGGCIVSLRSKGKVFRIRKTDEREEELMRFCPERLAKSVKKHSLWVNQNIEKS